MSRSLSASCVSEASRSERVLVLISTQFQHAFTDNILRRLLLPPVPLFSRLGCLDDENLNEVVETFATCDLPALWKPRSNQFSHVDACRIVGACEIDGVKSMAAAMA